MTRAMFIAAIAMVGLVLSGCSAAEVSSDEAPEPSPPNPPRIWDPDDKRESLPSGRPDITGVITEAKRGSGGDGLPVEQILVEEDPETGIFNADCQKGPIEAGCDKLYLTLHRETGVFRERGSGEAVTRARAADLKRGQRVRAWHTGLVMESYPGQTGARVIVIVGAEVRTTQRD